MGGGEGEREEVREGVREGGREGGFALTSPRAHLHVIEDEEKTFN